MNLLLVFLVSVGVIVGVKGQTWTKQWGSLKQITASDGIICGIDKENLIQCAVNGIKSSSPDWVSVPPPATSTPLQMAIYGKEMVMVDTSNGIYRAYYNGNSTQWTKIPGALNHVSIDGAQVCGCQGSDIFCGNYNRYTLSLPQECAQDKIPSLDHTDLTFTWVKRPGLLKKVTVRAGRIFGVDNNNLVFFGKSYGQPGWVKLPGSLTHISYDFDFKRLCGVQRNNEIYCATEDIFTNPKWKQVSGTLVNLELWGNRLYGVNANNEIFTTTF